jgi:hypothetical protein
LGLGLGLGLETRLERGLSWRSSAGLVDPISSTARSPWLAAPAASLLARSSHGLVERPARASTEGSQCSSPMEVKRCKVAIRS